MPGHIEGCGIGQHLESPREDIFARATRFGQLSRFHRQGWHQQQVVVFQSCVIDFLQFARQILCFGIEVAAMMADSVFTHKHRDLQCIGELVSSILPAREVIKQRRGIEAFPVHP